MKSTKQRRFYIVQFIVIIISTLKDLPLVRAAFKRPLRSSIACIDVTPTCQNDGSRIGRGFESSLQQSSPPPGTPQLAFVSLKYRKPPLHCCLSPPTSINRHSSHPVAKTLMMSISSANSEITFAKFTASFPSLLSAKCKLSNDDHIGIVIGNEAGDADSIVSALGLAYVDNIENDSNLACVRKEPIQMPIVSVPRADMPLRRDAALLLDLVGIDINNLIYCDDESVTNYLLKPGVSSIPRTITLVDHNRIRDSLTHLNLEISEIVDHHEDEYFHGHVTADSGKRIIEFDNGHATVASTCTLVVERLLRSIDKKTLESTDKNLDACFKTIRVDRSLGLALLGVILLDSINMLPEAGKGTARDESAIQTLLERTDWSSISSGAPSHTKLVSAETMKQIFPNGTNNMPDRTSLFEVLRDAKCDPQFWSEMSVKDCLRIDYKKFSVNKIASLPQLVSSIGISSVLIDLDDLMAKENFHYELAHFVTSERVGLFGVMSVCFRDRIGPTRELLLSGSDCDVVDSFADYLLLHPDAAWLEVTERSSLHPGYDVGTTTSTRVFRQGNGKGSRKQIAPVLLNYAANFSRL